MIRAGRRFLGYNIGGGPTSVGVFNMAEKTKSKRRLLAPKNPPDSFTRSELVRAIKAVAAAQRRRYQRPVTDEAK